MKFTDLFIRRPVLAIVVTASGGGCIAANCSAIAWNWRTLTNPRPAMKMVMRTSIRIIRLAIDVSSLELHT